MNLDRAKKTIFSFELLLVLYLFAGIYKTDPVLSFVPIDLTMLLGLASVAAGATVLFRNPQRVVTRTGIVILVFFALFTSYAGLSLVWSSSSSYAAVKLFKTAVLTGWLLAASALIIAPCPERRERLFHVFLLFAVWVAGESLFIHATTGGWGFIDPFGGTGYIGVSRIVGVGVLVASYRVYRARTKLARIGFVGLLAGLVFAMLTIGARGPLLAVGGGLFIIALGFAVGRTPSVQSSLQASAQVFASSVMVVLIAGFFQLTAVRRFSKLTGITELFPSGSESPDDAAAPTSDDAAARTPTDASDYAASVGDSAGSRLDYYQTAVELWQSAPLTGHGYGSFAVLNRGVDARHYPHNILLEVLSELGLVGFILLASLLAYPALVVIRAGRRNVTAHTVLIAGLVVYMLVNAMVSGDIPSNRALFMLLGLTALPHANSKRQGTESAEK